MINSCYEVRFSFQPQVTPVELPAYSEQKHCAQEKFQHL